MAAQARLPPIIGALVAFFVTTLIVFFEGSILLSYRAHDFLEASTGDIFTEGNDGVCVSYAKPSDVKSAYGGKINVVHPLGISSINAGGEDVDCDVTKARGDLANLVVASVHALHYSYMTESTPAVAEAYAAASRVALGEHNLVMNYTTALDAMEEVSKPPTSCDEIYNINATSAMLGTALASGEGFEVICGSQSDHLSVLASRTSSHLATLHRHCIEQFSIGRFAPKINAWSMGWTTTGTGGTFGVPLHGNVLEPALMPWTVPSGYNETMTWRARTTVLVGMRFGFGAWSSIATILLAVFLLFDNIYILIVHLTLSGRLSSITNTTPDTNGRMPATMTAMLVVYATAGAMRAERFFMAFFGWAAILILKSVFVLAPWNFGRLLPRATCESGTGWATDETSAFLDWLNIWLLLAVIIIVPLSQSSLFTVNYMKTYSDVGTEPVKAIVVPGAKRTRKFFGIAALGVIVMLIGQIWVASSFGASWAEAIAYGFPDATEDPRWDEDALANGTFSRTIGAMAIAIAGGIALASILSRWLFGGRSFCSCLVLFLWLLFTLMALIPLFLLEGFTFKKEDFEKDCDFDGGKTACNVRYYAYIIGFVLIFLPIVAMVFFCCCRNAFVLCQARTSGTAQRGPIFKRIRKRLQGAFRRSSGGAPVSATMCEDLPLLTIKMR